MAYLSNNLTSQSTNSDPSAFALTGWLSWLVADRERLDQCMASIETLLIAEFQRTAHGEETMLDIGEVDQLNQLVDQWRARMKIFAPTFIAEDLRWVRLPASSRVL